MQLQRESYLELFPTRGIKEVGGSPTHPLGQLPIEKESAEVLVYVGNGMGHGGGPELAPGWGRTSPPFSLLRFAIEGSKR